MYAMGCDHAIVFVTEDMEGSRSGARYSRVCAAIVRHLVIVVTCVK